MTREEAINEIKSWAIPSKKGREVLETLIPELRESEEERIREEIIDFIQWAEDREMTRHDYHQAKRPAVWIDYLEKLKEQKPLSTEETELNSIAFLEQMGYTCIPPRKEQKPAEYLDLDNASQDYVYDHFCQGADFTPDYIKGLMEDAFIDGANWQKEQKPVEWKPLPESMEALLLAIEGEWDAIKPTGYMSRRLEDLYDGLVNTFDIDEKYLGNLPKTEYTEKDIEEIKALKKKIDSSMETKPAEWSEDDEKMFERLKEILNIADGELYKKLNGEAILIGEAEFNYLKFGIAHCLSWLELRFKSLRPVKQVWSEEDEYKLNFLTGMLEGLDQKEFDTRYMKELSSWFKSLPERFSLQPKNEWSEEDEKMRRNLMSLLVNMRGDRITEETYQKYYPWLKDLRPSWKPSEEQMGALNYAYCELFKREDVDHNILGPLQNLIDTLRKL